MKRLLIAVLLLAGCGPQPMTASEYKTVADACESAGLKYRISGGWISCWKDKP